MTAGARDGWWRCAAWAALVLSAGQAGAQDRVDPPGYFVEAVFATTTAQIVARVCGGLSVDPVAVARVTEDVLDRLTADGFTPENLATRMQDPAPAIATLQDDFLARHALADGAPEAQVCDAGREEIAAQSAIGNLLVEAAGSEGNE